MIRSLIDVITMQKLRAAQEMMDGNSYAARAKRDKHGRVIRGEPKPVAPAARAKFFREVRADRKERWRKIMNGDA